MLDSYSSLFGYQIIPLSFMSDKVQARTHKKKRINKKWLKRYGMKEVPWNKIYIVGNSVILCHPKIVEKIKTDINMQKRVLENDGVY